MPDIESWLKNAVSNVKNWFNTAPGGIGEDERGIIHLGRNKPTPTPRQQLAPPAQAQAPQQPQQPQAPVQPNVEQQMRSGLTAYGGENLPALDYMPQFLEAMQRYPIFRDNPFLLPQIMMLETSGGQNVTRPNNLMNWGINYPGNNEAFAQMTPEEVLERMISGVGERMPMYDPFRTEAPLTPEQIMEFANIYEPANQSYGPNLLSGMQSFAGR